MSVINRMLQELESRHEQPQAKLPGIVRAVAPARDTHRRLVLLVLIALGAAALGGFALWAWQTHAVRPAPETEAGPTLPAAAPVAAVAPQQLPAPIATQPAEPFADNPAEKLVGELALTPPAAEPVSTEPVRKATPPSDANTAQAARDEEPPKSKQAAASATEAPKSAEPRVVKSTPGATSDAPGAGIKQVSPAQRADQSYREGLALRAQGRAAEAQGLLEEALRVDPHHLGARQALLGMLVDAKRYAQAEALLQDGLALNIAPPALAMALARLQTERGDQQAALATLERQMPQARDNADYHAFYAALLQRAERHAEAIGHYQAALRGQPNRAVWWMGLGISLQAAQRGADAAQAFSRARATPGLSPELQAFVEQRLKQLQ